MSKLLPFTVCLSLCLASVACRDKQAPDASRGPKEWPTAEIPPELDEPPPANSLENIHLRGPEEAVVQYEETKKSGAPLEVCVQAQMVTESYRHAKDNVNYEKWKAVEKQDCAKAGLK